MSNFCMDMEVNVARCSFVVNYKKDSSTPVLMSFENILHEDRLIYEFETNAVANVTNDNCVPPF